MSIALAIVKGAIYVIQPGDHCELQLVDGSVLNLEQTEDDFTLTRSTGLVAYTTPTSPFAKDETDFTEQTTGRN